MAEIKDIKLLDLRLRFADGSSMEIDHPDKVTLLWVRPFAVAESETDEFHAPRLDLGRFLRAKSLVGLVRSLAHATSGWPWSGRRRVCRELAARIFARGPSKVEALFGRGDLGEKSIGDRLVDEFLRAHMISLASVPPSATPEQICRYQKHHVQSLAKRWSEPGEDNQAVLDRLEFLTDPAIQRLSDEERASQLQQRFALPIQRARRYTHAVSPPDGPLAVFAYLWLSGRWDDGEEASREAQSPESWENTAWGRFLVERVIPNYPTHRALEFNLRRGLRKLRRQSKQEVENLALLAVLQTVDDAHGLADYLQAFVAGPHWHGGPRGRTWSALLRRHQRQVVKESVEVPADPRYMTASDQIEDLPAPAEADLPDTSDLDLSALSPAERRAVEEMVTAMSEGYGRHSKQGKSLKDWWGPRYPARIRALSRAKAKLMRS